MDAVADALLAAVFAAPADDTPRLVYADHLDETGRPADAARAAFIRLQCEHVRSPHPELHERAEALRRRYAQLWERPARARLPFRKLATDWRYRRGFVASVRSSTRNVFGRPDDVFAVGPLEHIRMTEFPWQSPPAVPAKRVGLTALTLPGFDLSWMAGAYPAVERWTAALAGVPALILPSTRFASRGRAVRLLGPAIAAGRLSPVLVFPLGGDVVTFDPQGLWPTVEPVVLANSWPGFELRSLDPTPPRSLAGRLADWVRGR